MNFSLCYLFSIQKTLIIYYILDYTGIIAGLATLETGLFGMATNLLNVGKNKNNHNLNAMKRFCICSLRPHLNVLTFFPPD